MPKTYTAAGSATAGQVYTASAHNVIVEDVNNLIVPPMCQVRRSSDLGSYSSGAAVTWSDAIFDTDGMFSSGAATRITINTSGIYLVSVYLYLTATATLTSVDLSPQVNGTGVGGNVTAPSTTTTHLATWQQILELSATNYLTLNMFLQGGSNYTVKGSAGRDFQQTRMTATWIGRTS